ncbi:MAG: hypothetical protein LBT68_08345 [Spirochaetales bacterium]|jgi:hypothetical protein|nr:hypothetical protein [Spirochaetales bacterium]
MTKKKSASPLIPFLLALHCALAFSGCASLVEKAGRAFDGSAFEVEELALYRLAWPEGFTDAEGEEFDKEESGSVEVRRLRRNIDGGEFISITLGVFPTLRINATLPGAEGGFYLTSIDFLCSSFMGWNEFTLDISGGGTFRGSGGSAFLRIEAPVEAAGISKGKIRRAETRLSGQEALTALRNRFERITALTQWMLGQKDAPPFHNAVEFANWWQPFILPETLAPGLRPPAWTKDGSLWQRAEDIDWNTSYTRKTFPEDLWKVRDSGTLLRDWEEALDWIYLMYEWEDLFYALSNGIILEGVQ